MKKQTHKMQIGKICFHRYILTYKTMLFDVGYYILMLKGAHLEKKRFYLT